MRAPDPSRHREIALLGFAAALLLLASPLRSLWLGDAVSWWVPFAIWGGLIGLGAIIAGREGA